MESPLEKQETFTTVFTPSVQFPAKGLTGNDLVIGSFGHASAYILCSVPSADLLPLGNVQVTYHNEHKSVFSLYSRKSDPAVIIAVGTENFKSQFAGETLWILFQTIKSLKRVVVLDTVPSMSYVFGQYEDNRLLCLSNRFCPPAKAGCGKMPAGASVGGLIGSVLTRCEIAKVPCYAYLGVMQEYSTSIESVKVFTSVGEVLGYLKLAVAADKHVIAGINAKLDNNLYS
ncbi:MAG: hypothetical protein P4M11_12410 [Candidatus Pacebacteria bacterium]|nr:hypothetical protein [Candidatus Paceibacterota bacterium]